MKFVLSVLASSWLISGRDKAKPQSWPGSDGWRPKDIIEHYMKHKELADIEKRIEAIEERL